RCSRRGEPVRGHGARPDRTAALRGIRACPEHQAPGQTGPARQIGPRPDSDGDAVAQCPSTETTTVIVKCWSGQLDLAIASQVVAPFASSAACPALTARNSAL